jgi:tetratricopeptide (TPR) repeat protein
MFPSRYLPVKSSAFWVAGVNLGVRHILPLYPIAAILAGAGVADLAQRSNGWLAVGILLLAAHIVSSFLSFPVPIAYANELWGGAGKTYLYLSDSNVDWGQQLYQVKDWGDRHPEECWFAYVAQGYISPKSYGIRCHALPNPAPTRFGASEAEMIPPTVHGTVLLSAKNLAGYWITNQINPYRDFLRIQPTDQIDHGILVYHGDIDLKAAAAVSRAFLSGDKLNEKKFNEALSLAKESLEIAPGNFYGEWALGSAEAALGRVQEASNAYQAALNIANSLDPVRASTPIKELKEAMKKLKE